MKYKVVLPLVILTLLASLSLVSKVSAVTLQEKYGFSTSFVPPPYEFSYVLPAGFTEADIDSSFGVSITGFTNPYSISPVSPATAIQKIYLGHSLGDLAVDVTGADLGTTFSASGPPYTDTQNFSATGVSLGDISGYSYITIFTNFNLGGDTLADGDGSIVIYSVPEPSTWALLFAGAGFLGFVAIRRARNSIA